MDEPHKRCPLCGQMMTSFRTGQMWYTAPIQYEIKWTCHCGYSENGGTVTDAAVLNIIQAPFNIGDKVTLCQATEPKTIFVVTKSEPSRMDNIFTIYYTIENIKDPKNFGRFEASDLELYERRINA